MMGNQTNFFKIFKHFLAHNYAHSSEMEISCSSVIKVEKPIKLRFKMVLKNSP